MSKPRADIHPREALLDRPLDDAGYLLRIARTTLVACEALAEQNMAMSDPAPKLWRTAEDMRRLANLAERYVTQALVLMREE